MKAAANGELRRLVAYNKFFKCTAVQLGDTGLFIKSANKQSVPRWRGPAEILDIDETGATVKVQLQTFEVARHRVREKVDEGMWEMRN